MTEEQPVTRTLEEVFDAMKHARDGREASLDVREIGVIKSVGDGIVRVDGLHHARNDELLRFPGGILGQVFNLDRHEVGAILLDMDEGLEAGDEVARTGRVLDVPVGPALIGRVVDALGRPLDEKGPVITAARWPVEREAPDIMKRAPVSEPLQTGIKAIDTLIPIGKGQRELILGDRQTGKTAIALDAILNQKDKDVLCVYCAIGKQKSAVAKVAADLKKYGAMAYSTVVVASADAPPGLLFVAAYAATSIAEYFFSRGRDVLIVYDDLTWHARAYRELSLLLRRPPGREAYPGDIFYVHARLLERATHLREEYGGGSLTALPIIETQAQNLASYIPTNLISITDGQIYLSPVLFSKGQLPAIEVGKSVSRVGGRAQLPALRKVAGKLRLSYAQFQELEAFARFSTRLDSDTRYAIEHGRRIRELLKQDQYDHFSQAEQFAILMAITEGILDRLDPEEIQRVEKWIRENLAESLAQSRDRIEKGEEISSLDWEAFEEVAREAVGHIKNESQDGTA